MALGVPILKHFRVISDGVGRLKHENFRLTFKSVSIKCAEHET